MRNLFLIVLLLFTVEEGIGQSKGGDFIMEGGFNYRQISNEISFIPGRDEEEVEKTILFNPRAGIYLKNDILFGINFSYTQFDNTVEQFDIDPFTNTLTKLSTNQTENQYRYGLFLTTQSALFKKLFFRLDFGANVIQIDARISRTNGNDSELKGEGIGFNITPGLIYFISNKMAISGSFGGIQYENLDLKYSLTGSSSTPQEKIKDLGVSFNPSQFLLSMMFIFPDKQTPINKELYH